MVWHSPLFSTSSRRGAKYLLATTMQVRVNYQSFQLLLRNRHRDIRLAIDIKRDYESGDECITSSSSDGVDNLRVVQEFLQAIEDLLWHLH